MNDLEKLIPIHFAKKREELTEESALLFDSFIVKLDGGKIRAKHLGQSQPRICYLVLREEDR